MAACTEVAQPPPLLLPTWIRECLFSWRTRIGRWSVPVWCTRDPGTSLSTGERAGQFSSVEGTGETLPRQTATMSGFCLNGCHLNSTFTCIAQFEVVLSRRT
eukprot:COSAG01_NODE_507_length_16108_cov_18.603973_20_plen_102_part_00